MIVIISLFRTQRCTARVPALRQQPSRVERFATKAASLQLSVGQVAQVVERSPEKAGVGGSTPSLATMFLVTCPVLSSLPHLAQLQGSASYSCSETSCAEAFV